MNVTTNLPHVSIAGTDVEKIEYQGQPVVTFAMIDKVHQRVEGTARRTFNENRERFISGEDFIELTSDEIRTMSSEGVFAPRTARANVITRRGYLKITKSLNDDRAWEVFDEMVERYFSVEAAPQQIAIPTTAEAFASAFQMIAATERTQAVHSKAIAHLKEQVEKVETAQTVLRSRPANAEGITHIRQRINRLYGLSANVIDEVMRQSPYAPKPAGMVRNDHVDADGSLYAVYWTKDITKTFDRFVDECEPVTNFLFTHPFIEGRFRVARKAVVA